MKLNLNQIDLNDMENLTEVPRGKKRGNQTKIKDPRNKGKGKKPRKFRDYNKNNNR